MNHHSVDVCVIEDDHAERALLVKRLRRLGYSTVDAVTGVEGLRAVYEHRPRVLICDLVLPELDGLQVCRQVRADPTLDGTYIVLVTAHDRGERKKKALFAGADDYLCKPYDPDELYARIRNGMRYHRLHERLKRAALTDGLTGLWNHLHFRELLDREFQRARRYGGVVSLLMLDLDHFKAINDTYGHETGNTVLKLTARHLRRTVRDIDIVARYGGEEFTVVCPETRRSEAVELAERLRRSLADDLSVPDQPDISVRVSIGVASTDDSRVHSMSDLIDLSDRALYISKHRGRDRVTDCGQLDDHAEPIYEIRIDEVDRLRKEVVGLSMRAKDLHLQSVWALIQALEARDGYSAWHSRNVTLYTRWLVEAAGWSPPMIQAVTNAAMLHDLGKIGVPDRLLMTPRPLDPREAAVLRQVPLITCKILEPLRVFETEMLIIRHIRENFDGTGYPDGLAGDSIPVGSRVLSLTEAFDSITCNRAHRPGRSVDEALATIVAERGRQFDSKYVDLLQSAIAQNRARWQEQVERARIELPDVVAAAESA